MNFPNYDFPNERYYRNETATQNSSDFREKFQKFFPIPNSYSSHEKRKLSLVEKSLRPRNEDPSECGLSPGHLQQGSSPNDIMIVNGFDRGAKSHTCQTNFNLQRKERLHFTSQKVSFKLHQL